MGSPQFSIRIPPDLDKLIKEYAAKHNTTKSNIMLSALARYLDYAPIKPLSERVRELEEQMAKVQAKLDKLEASAN